jgi:hypothetical protein
MKVKAFFSTPLVDKKIGGTSWMTRMTVEDYLKLVNLKNNPYQRNILSVKLYSKLIDDLLNDTVIPPISIVYPDVNLNLNEELKTDVRCTILDGLQRTNSLLQCLDRLEKQKAEGSIATVDLFNKKEIYVEIWEKLELKNILYKMVVLNTGQKKMDYSHQLEILNENLLEQLNALNVTVSTTKEKLPGRIDFQLSDIVEGLVSYINKFPISGKKNAAEFLFERFEVGLDSKTELENNNNKTLSVISDPQTYLYLEWVLKRFDMLIQSAYQDRNPLRQYNAFLVGLFAALGYSNGKNPEALAIKIKVLEEKMKNEPDPLQIDLFTNYYNKYKTGIGERRRKFVFEAFRSFFTTAENIDSLEWDETYERFS